MHPPAPQALKRASAAVFTLGLACCLAWTAPPVRAASETLTPEPGAQAYNFVTHYRTRIEASPADVWTVLTDLGAWMYEFELTTVSGTPGAVGHVTRLYEGQAFMTQVTAVVPQQLLAVVNLPLTFQGEHGTGVGIFTLHGDGNFTEVALSMSRRYAGTGEGYAELRTRRGSTEFQARTRAMWQDRFLGRLKQLAEAQAP